ncbi:MAG: hypothetical protein H6673_03995 [Anaerolineales bacterium]|nr:hypothetical protein [Anaerolineales bacterium]
MLRILPAIFIPLGLPILTLILGKPDTPTMIFTIILTVVTALVSAYGFSQDIKRQLRPIHRTLDLLQSNELTIEQATSMKATQGTEPLMTLRRRMGEVGEEVIKRETQLRHQVVELQVVIDQHQKEATVEQITNSDFFQDLQKRAKDWRKTD